MIDVTDGGIKTAKDKLSIISKWIEEQKLEKFTIQGFIHAPGAKMENESNENATIIADRKALRYLGCGLEQIHDWFIEDVSNK